MTPCSAWSRTKQCAPMCWVVEAPAKTPAKPAAQSTLQNFMGAVLVLQG